MLDKKSNRLEIVSLFLFSNICLFSAVFASLLRYALCLSLFLAQMTHETQPVMSVVLPFFLFISAPQSSTYSVSLVQLVSLNVDVVLLLAAAGLHTILIIHS